MKINFASTRLAFFLIAIIFILIVISAIIPQKELAANQIIDWHQLLGDNYKFIEMLKLDQIFESSFFFVILGLLGLNLIFGNFKRFKIIYKTEKTLIKARHIGSIIFHLSLVTLMLGIILNYLYKFDGALALIEGQTVIDNEKVYSNIFKGPFYNDSFGRFEIKHSKFYTDYEINNTTTNAAEISIKEAPMDQGKKAIITTNFPMTFYNLEIHFGQLIGYAPEIILMNSKDSIIFQSFIRVAVQKHQIQNKHADYYIIPETNHKISIEIVPNHNSIDSTFYNLIVEKDDIMLYEGIVQSGDTALFNDYKIAIPRLRNWCYINVIKSPYLNLVFFSFWMALIGMTIGFIPRVIGNKKKIS